MVLSIAKLTDEFQITIPSEVRRRLGLEAGALVYLAIEEEKVVLRAVRGGWTEATKGLGADLWKAEGGTAAIERERESWE
ncbi:MAG TPA: AbrB/MazE/SpoVT family DNA-binding domain-containing protein [Thermoanaerobaculia bacterium]